MRILLIRPRPDKETIGLQSVMICQPLELMELSAVLKNNGHEVEIIDMILEKKSLEYFVRKTRPHLVGLTGYISHIGIMKEYARRIKTLSPKIRIAVGGVHATVCPQDFIDPHIDDICRSAEDLYDLTLCKNRLRVLPFRDLPQRYQKRYYYLFQERCALIKTSYGCPYQCRFCFCKEIAPYKARPIEEVVEELDNIPQHEVYIVDDDFLFDTKRLWHFIHLLKEKELHKHFLVYGRADFIAHNEEIIQGLWEVGLRSVIVGIEASNQEELDRYNKKTKLDDNVKAIKVLQKYGIECYATVILGMDWGKKEFKALKTFITKNNLVFVNLQPLTPMPATPFFEELQNDLLIPYTDHAKWDMAHLVIKPQKLSVRQYYWQIIALYYGITMTPKNTLYMFRRYGVATTLKLSVGAVQITMQYLKKIFKG